MIGKWSLQQIFLRTLIGAIVFSALIGVYAFAFGNFGETEIKILLTTLSVSYFSVTSLACAAAIERGRMRGLALPGLVAGIGGFGLGLVMIWAEIWMNDSEGLVKTFLILILFSLSFAQVCLLSFAPLKRSLAWVFLGALACIFGLALVLSTMLVFEIYDEWAIRLAGVLGILDGCATLAIPILFKLGSGRIIEKPTEKSARQIELTCPGCGERGTYTVGRIECPGCSLAIRVEILDVASDATTKRKRPAFQFSLRSMMIVTLIASVFLSWLGVRLTQLRRQKVAVARIEAMGATVQHDYGTAVRVYFTSANHAFNSRDFAYISDLPRLKTIVLRDIRVTDDDLAHLASLSSLAVLEINNTNITDAGLVHVVSLPALKGLQVKGTQITSAGLEQLSRMRTLKYLEISAADFSGRDASGLRRALPNLEIRYRD